MNRFILIIFSILAPLDIMGQMFPLSNHYLFNPLAINPASAGYQEAISATVIYRNQWIGFKDAPKSYNLTLHSPLHNDRVGLGFLLETNSIGIFKETRVMGNYAYRGELFNGKIALGLGFGATIYNIRWDELDAADYGDPNLMNNPESVVLPDFSLGTYYYTRRYFIGFSIPRFLSHEWDQNTGHYKVKNHFSGYNYFFTGGYRIDISPHVQFLPSVLFKYNPAHAPQVDCYAKIILKEKFRMGMGYRNQNILVGILQCQFNSQLGMEYSFDFDTGGMGKYMKGSHELGLNYVFSYAHKVTGPRQF